MPDENNPIENQSEEIKPEENKTDDYSQLKGALDKERQQKRSLEAQLKKFQGIDPEKYQSFIELEKTREQEEQERTRKELEAKAKYEEAIALLEKQSSTQQQALQARVLELEKQIAEKEQAIANKNISVEFQRAFLEAGGIPNSVKFLQRELESYLKYDEKGDRVQILDPATGVEVSDKKGGAIALKEWIEGYKANYPNLFKAENNANGSGANPSRNGGIINNKVDYSRLSSVEKMRMGRNGQ